MAVQTAIKAGYRLIDCANDYNNEHIIGEALQELFKEGNVKRSDLFIQAKLWNGNHRPEHVEDDLDATLKDLQLDYVDSYIIHWPMACPSTGKNATLRSNGCYMAHHSKSNFVSEFQVNVPDFRDFLFQIPCFQSLMKGTFPMILNHITLKLGKQWRNLWTKAKLKPLDCQTSIEDKFKKSWTFLI